MLILKSLMIFNEGRLPATAFEVTEALDANPPATARIFFGLSDIMVYQDSSYPQHYLPTARASK
jgi:hypothetical protein